MQSVAEKEKTEYLFLSLDYQRFLTYILVFGERNGCYKKLQKITR